MKKTRNKAGLFKRTALIMSALLLFASLVTGVFVFLNGDADVAEASYDGSGTVKLELADTSTVAKGKSTIPAIGRSGESWWKFTVNGIKDQTIFCLNSGAKMCSGDTVSWNVYSATDFASKVSSNLAKAMTYYNKTLNCGSMSGLTKSQTQYAVQAYCWAASKSNAVIKQAVSEALQNTGMSSTAAASYADTLCTNIANTSPSGQIYYYTTTKHKSSNSSVESTHQHLIGWEDKTTDIKYATTYDTATVTAPLTYEFSISKSDKDSGDAIDADFIAYLDGDTLLKNATSLDNVKSVGAPVMTSGTYDSKTGTFSTKDGLLSFTVTLTLEGDDVESKKYTYVVNWDELTTEQQKEELAKGNYASQSSAWAVAHQEALSLQATAQTNLEKTTFEWTVEEVKGSANDSKGYTTAAAQTKKTSSKVLTYTFEDTPIYTRAYIEKTSEDGGEDLSMKGAVYSIYANEEIDTGSVHYDKDQYICSLTIKEISEQVNNKTVYYYRGWSAYSLPEGFDYYAKETTAPEKFNLNDTVYYFTTDIDELDVLQKANSSRSYYTKDNTAGTKYTVNVNAQQSDQKITDTPISRPVIIYKNYEYVDANTGEIVVDFEAGAEFTLTEIPDDSTKTAKTYTFKYIDTEILEDGLTYAVYKIDAVPYGNYVIQQTKWRDGTIPMDDTTISVTEGTGALYKPLTVKYTDKLEKAGVSVSKSMAWLTESGSETTALEEGAEFVVLRSAAEADGKFLIYGFEVAADGSVSITQGSFMDPTALNDLTAEQRQQYVERLKAYAKSSLGGVETAFAMLTATADNGTETASIVDIVTDSYGRAFSYVDTYDHTQYLIVLQINGEEGYTLSKVIDESLITIAADSTECASVSLKNNKVQSSVTVTKSICDVDGSNVEAEYDAEFTLLDADFVTTANIKTALEAEYYDYDELVAEAGAETAKALLAVMDEDQRQIFADYVETLGTGAKIGAFTTGTDGIGGIILFDADAYANGFVLLQTEGTDGYALMPALWQSEAVSKEDVDAMTKEEYEEAKAAGLMIWETQTIEGDICDRILTNYSVEYTDVFDDYGYVEIYKTAETGNGTWVAEKGATFILYDENGDQVMLDENTELVLTTDDNGFATTEGTGVYLKFGRYTIVQTYSPGNHALMEEAKFYLTKQYKHAAITLSYANNSNPVTLILTKYSDDVYGKTRIQVLSLEEDKNLNEYVDLDPVEGATYTVYAVEDIVESTTVKVNGWSSEEDSNGTTIYYNTLYHAREEVGSFTTNENGKGTISLPYGTYYLEESSSPGTYVKSEERIYFTIYEDVYFDGSYYPVIRVYDISDYEDLPVITMDELSQCPYSDNWLGTALGYGVDPSLGIDDDTYVAFQTVYETPVYGQINVEKVGQKAVQSEDGESAFEYTYVYEPLEGCIFALYAAEDIYTIGGTLVWEEGTLVSTVTTDENGEGTFSWYKDGEETTDLYLGSYYVVETYAPYGYTYDDTPYCVVLTYDHTAESVDSARTDEDANETGSAVGNSGLEASSGDYILITGEELNPYLTSAAHVIFTWKNVPSGVTATDVSSKKNGTVMLWTVEDTVYISTCTENAAEAHEVIFNVDSAGMFKDCMALTSISFNNVDTSECVYMSSMFENCISIEVLDLSMFDTNKVQYVDSMFEGCGGLKTIYVSTDTTVFNYEDATLTYIDAEATHTFMSNYSYMAGDEEVTKEGDTFTASDFTFTGWYTADYFPTAFPGYLTITDSDIASFYPAQANKDDAIEFFKMKESDKDGAYYTMLVTITLTEEYVSALEAATGAEAGTINRTIDVIVTVCDPTLVGVEFNYDDHPTVTVTAQDELISLSVELWKIDEDSVGADDDDKEYLSGAEYTVYANCLIGYKDENGDFVTLYEPGEPVGVLSTLANEEGVSASIDGLLSDAWAVKETYLTPTVESGHENDATISYITSTGITTEQANKVSSKSDFMYYIVETAHPLNYSLSYDRWYISGDLDFLTDTAEKSVTYTNSEGLETTLTWTVNSTSEILLTSEIEVDNPESEYLSVAKEWDDGDDTDPDPSAPEDRPSYVVYRMAGTTTSGKAEVEFDYILVLSEDELKIYSYTDNLWNPSSLSAFETLLSGTKAIATYDAHATTCTLEGNDLWHANLDLDYNTATSDYVPLLKDGTAVTTFVENRTILHMQNPTYNPKSTGNNHTENDYVYMSVDTSEFDIHVEKYWADQNNVDQKRATSVSVKLSYKDGDESRGGWTATVKLDASNNWEYTWTGLTGDIDDYTVEETSGTYYDKEWEYLTGESKIGYAVSYSSFSWDEEACCYDMLITNTHGDTPKLTATKAILYEDLEKWLKADGTRDFTVAFTITGTLEAEDGKEPVTYTDTKYVSFEYSKLSEYKTYTTTETDGDGKVTEYTWVSLSATFGDPETLNFGDYTVTEQVYNGVVTTDEQALLAGTDIHWELTGVTAKNGTVLYDSEGNPTGEATFDVSSERSSSYSYTVTFENELHANPKISVSKRVLADEIEWVDGDSTFTFVLTSTENEEGKEIELSKSVTFAKDEIDAMIEEAKKEAADAGEAWDGYLTLTVVFGDTDADPNETELPFGTYTLTEENEILWKIKSITYDSPLDATVDLASRSISFKVTADSATDIYYTYFTNTPYLGSIHVFKYDTDGNTLLNDVTFELQNEKGEVLYNVDGEILRATTGQDGQAEGEVLFERLKAGTYYLTEVETAEGHTLLTERIAVTIPTAKTEAEIEALENAGYSVNLDGENTNTIDGTTYFWDLSFTVTNSIQLEMPNSGILDISNGVPMLPVAICIASACAIGAWVLIRRRRTARLLRA